MPGQPILAKLGRFQAGQVWPTSGQLWSVQVRLRPTSVDFRTAFADFGPGLADLRPALVDLGPCFAGLGRFHARFGRVRPRFDRIRASLCRSVGNLGRIRPISGHFSLVSVQVWATSHKTRSIPGRFRGQNWPTSVQLWLVEIERSSSIAPSERMRPDRRVTAPTGEV